MPEYLVSWIGDNDMFGYLHHQTAMPIEELLKTFPGRLRKKHQPREYSKGSIAAALRGKRFDKAFLFSPYERETIQKHVNWLAEDTGMSADAIQSSQLSGFNVINYGEVLHAFSQALDELWRKKRRDDKFTFSLTSGTPTMTVAWVLLGRTRFPASYLQTNEDRIVPTEIPINFVTGLMDEIVSGVDGAVGQEELSREIIGESQGIVRARKRVFEVARHNLPVLVTGESGTGKELFAHAVHRVRFNSDTKGHTKPPFVAVNCGAIPETLSECELFGHERGAFTGATKKRDGAFQIADGGTLFLDEIGEMPLHVQPKLLRATQWRDDLNSYAVVPVGSNKEEPVAVNLIYATNRNLAEMTAAGRFRRDLFYRIKILEIHIPPLRERGEDALLLAENYFQKLGIPYRFDNSAKQALLEYDWPGNVRELHGVLSHLAVAFGKEQIIGDDVRREIREMSLPGADAETDSPESLLKPGFNLPEHLDAVRNDFIRRALAKTDGNRGQAFKLLGYKNKGTFYQHCKDAE